MGHRRSYASADVADLGSAWRVLLDGKAAQTPAGRPLDVSSRALAQAVAEEFAAQGAIMDPGSMPLARLAHVALDADDSAPASLRADIIAYAGSDLLYYRASHPETLVAAQRAAWDPVLDWARARFEARFVLAEGVMHVAQPPESLAAVARRIDAVGDRFALVALHLMTTLTGSSLLALAIHDGAFPVASAWSAAHVDEDHQQKTWGVDTEVAHRRAQRWGDMRAAARLLDLLAPQAL